MSDYADICKCLRSEKVTERSKVNSKRISEFIAEDKNKTSLTGKQWLELLRHFLHWENVEIEAAFKKNRPCNIDNAILVKQVVKYGSKVCIATSSKIRDIFHHVLRIMMDRELEIKYREHHLELLCELLSTSQINHALSMDVYENIFDFISNVISAHNITDRFFSRLLRSFCRALFLDATTALIPRLLGYFNNLLQESMQDALVLEKALLAICDCYTSLIRQHGVNIIADVFRHSELLLSVSTQHLSAITIHHRDPIISFLDTYMILCAPSDVLFCAPSKSINPLSNVLVLLHDTVLEEGYVKSLQAYVQINKKSKDVFQNYLEDSKYYQNILVSARILYHCAAMSLPNRGVCALYQRIEGAIPAYQEYGLHVFSVLCETYYHGEFYDVVADTKMLGMQLTEWVGLLANKSTTNETQVLGSLLIAMKSAAVASQNLLSRCTPHIASQLRKSWVEVIYILVRKLQGRRHERCTYRDQILDLFASIIKTSLIPSSILSEYLTLLWQYVPELSDHRAIESPVVLRYMISLATISPAEHCLYIAADYMAQLSEQEPHSEWLTLFEHPRSRCVVQVVLWLRYQFDCSATMRSQLPNEIMNLSQLMYRAIFASLLNSDHSLNFEAIEFDHVFEVTRVPLSKTLHAEVNALDGDLSKSLECLNMLDIELMRMLEKENTQDDAEYVSPSLCIAPALIAGYAALINIVERIAHQYADADDRLAYIREQSLSHMHRLIAIMCKILTLRTGLLQGGSIVFSMLSVFCACLEISKPFSRDPELFASIKLLYQSVLSHTYISQDKSQSLSRSSSSNSRNRNANNVDDDFMEDAPVETNGFKSDFDIEEKMLRANVSEKQVHLLMRIARAIMLISPENDAAQYVIESLLSVVINGENKSLLFPPEVLCRMGFVISSVSVCDAIRYVLTTHPWDAHMGACGYAAILQLISTMLSHTEEFTSCDHEDILREVHLLVFPTHHALMEYQNIYWKVRYETLFCVARLFKLNPEAYKHNFAEVVMTSLGDVEIRVRIAAGRIFPVVLQLLKSHERIYDSLVESLDIGQLCEPQNFDDSHVLNVMSHIHVLSQCAMSSDVICLRAVKDILCITTANQVFSGSIFNILDVSRAALVNVAKIYSYANEIALLLDNSLCLMKEWYKFSLAQNCNWELREFPYLLFGYDEFKAFSRRLGAAIVPVICDLPDSARWKIFVSFARDLEYGSHDGGVCACLVDYLHSALACHFLSNSADQRILKFIRRILDKTVIAPFASSNFTAIIEQILLQAPHCITSDDYDVQLRGALLSAANFLQPGANNLASECNLLQVLSTLRSKMLSCSLMTLLRQYLEAFRVLASVTLPHITVFNELKYRSVVCAFLNVLQTATKIASCHTDAIVDIMRDIASVIHDGWLSIPSSYMEGVASEMIIQVVGLIVALNRNSRTPALQRSFRIIEQEFGCSFYPQEHVVEMLGQLLDKLMLKAPSSCLCFPLHESFVEVLPQSSQTCHSSRSAHQQVADFVTYCTNYLAGHVASPVLLRFQILMLHELIAMKDISFDHSELSSLTMSLVALGKHVGTSQLEVQEEISLLLGSIGPLDIYQLPHTSMNSPIVVACSLDVAESMIQIIKRLFGCMWNNDASLTIVARDALRLLALHPGIHALLLLRQNIESDDMIKICLEHSPAVINHSNEAADDCWADEIWNCDNITYELWICRVVSSLLRKYFPLKTLDKDKEVDEIVSLLSCLGWITEMHSGIAEIVFPLVTYGLFQLFDSQLHDILSDRILKYMLDSKCSMIQASKLAVDTMVFLLRQHIRAFVTQSSRSVKKRPIGSHMRPKWVVPFNCRLNIDYSVAVSAAIRCGSVCSALMLMELSMEVPRHEGNDVMSSDDVSNLLLIYRDLHDADAIYGISMTPSLEMQGAVFAHTGHWAESLATYESLAQLGSTSTIVSPTSGIAMSLQGLGAQFVLQHLDFDDASEAMGEACWRNLARQGKHADKSLRQWNLNRSGSGVEDYYNRSISSALRVVGSKTKSNSLLHFADGMFLDIISSAARQSGHNLIQLVSKLQKLTEIEEVLLACREDDVTGALAELMQLWERRLEHVVHTSTLAESTLALRLSIMTQLHQSVDVTEPLFSLLHQICESSSSVTIAHSFSPLVYKIRSLLPLSGDNVSLLPLRWSIEECRFLWRKSQGDVALRSILQNVIAPLKTSALKDTSEYNHLLSEALRLAGEWMASRRSISGSDIISEYLAPAVALATTTSQAISAHSTLAKFYVKLFATIKERVNSVEWAQGQQVIADRRVEYEECRELLRGRIRERKSSNTNVVATDSYRQLQRHVGVLDRELAMDLRERESVEKSISNYLCEALEHFGQVIVMSSNMDEEFIFDIVHLWLENVSCEEVHPIMNNIIRRASSAKFVPLVYQLVSRLQKVSNDLSSAEKAFQVQLVELLCKMCRDHPFHVIPLLFSVINDMKGTKITATTRQLAVTDIVQRLKKDFSAVNHVYEKLLDVMNVLLKAYISLANANVDKYAKGGRHRSIRFVELQGRADDFSTSMDPYAKSSDVLKSCLPCILTRHLTIRMDKYYSDAPRVLGFKNTFSIPESGISHPKIVDCMGSDGITYRQLVKGGDDTRQDAVISQVFEHVNRMFRQNHDTRKRQLQIRTYKVIPTTDQSGVIEWVQDTVPFGGYLCDSKDGSTPGAHSRYYPYDLTHAQCREMLSEAKDNLEKRFDEIISRFHPAFRFFFLERFPHPTEWMTARLAYTRSVAATSMIGYLLGVGDRHSHNILVDSKTGEVVHIDFGIMFEQGKALGVPETVPFRLTRDVVDGMGISGYEGTYRKCCEEALKVLRSNVSQLLTILEVIIHDPLYKWTLSPLQARRRQGGVKRLHEVAESAAASRNPSRDAAHRALLRIKGKLQGYEDPNGDSLSISGQVEFLINEAKDPRNLCKLYAGWSPWL